MNKKIEDMDVGSDKQERILNAIEHAFTIAEVNYNNKNNTDYGLSEDIRLCLKHLSDLSPKAASTFTNIMTCMAIKSAFPKVDMRYHQTQIQDETNRPAGFNFRGVSENIIYPWLNSHSFEGAKSGWQTRTLERPKPYTLDYDENIMYVKDSFLKVFNEIEEHGQSAANALSYMLYLQFLLRESKLITLSIPKTNDISLIVDVFENHFFHKYRHKGASRLPVLAIYSIYSLFIEQLERYEGMELKLLEEHSAADSQTGAVGDIEVIHSDSKEVFEAIEVKHNIPITKNIIQDAARKIMDKSVDRYFILTTHSKCDPNETLQKKILDIESLYHCQIIANGVIPSLTYYLRMISEPNMVFYKYVELLKHDNAIKHEHRQVWNEYLLKR